MDLPPRGFEKKTLSHSPTPICIEPENKSKVAAHAYRGGAGYLTPRKGYANCSSGADGGADSRRVS